MEGTAEMIFSGDELLRGDTLNTNQAYLGDRLLGLGLLATRALCIADDLEALTRAIADSLARRPAVLVLSGGLGPTEDDLTREAVAAALDLPLELRDDLLEAIRARFASRGRVMSDTDRKQALLPRGATALPFPGTAPGFTLDSGRTLLTALPGVPWELKEMWENHLEPLIEARTGADGAAGDHADLGAAGLGAAAHEVRRLRVFGLGESVVAQMLSDLDWHDPRATLGTRATLDGVTLVLRGTSTTVGRRKLDMLQNNICTRLGDHVYSLLDEDLQIVVGNLLRNTGLTVSTAESCTGGLLAKRITDVPGSSDYFLGGVVAYDNRVKIGLLGVDASLLAQKGAVSEEVAIAMVEGVCHATGSDCGLSTTGIAGPDGGTQDKPVGLVYVGTSVRGATRVERLNLFGGRENIRERAAYTALDLLRRRLSGQNRESGS